MVSVGARKELRSLSVPSGIALKPTRPRSLCQRSDSSGCQLPGSFSRGRKYGLPNSRYGAGGIRKSQGMDKVGSSETRPGESDHCSQQPSTQWDPWQRPASQFEPVDLCVVRFFCLSSGWRERQTSFASPVQNRLVGKRLIAWERRKWHGSSCRLWLRISIAG